MDYGNVLSRAWQIIWKHKVLWIFGILAAATAEAVAAAAISAIPPRRKPHNGCSPSSNSSIACRMVKSPCSLER